MVKPKILGGLLFVRKCHDGLRDAPVVKLLAIDFVSIPSLPFVFGAQYIGTATRSGIPKEIISPFIIVEMFFDLVPCFIIVIANAHEHL
jgi:hypothetical protein